jgi:hypothetical protein
MRAVKRRIFALILAAVVSLCSTAAHAAEREDAIAAAKAVIAALAEKNFGLIWDTLASETFRKSGSREMFVLGYPQLRQKIGRLTSSNVLHVVYTPPRPRPDLGMTGKGYAVAFQNVYTTGALDEQIYLIEENGQFKMLGWGPAAAVKKRICSPR